MKLFIIVVLAYLWANIYTYNVLKKENDTNVAKYNQTKTVYKNLVKKIWNNITKLNQTDKKLVEFKTNKLESKVFYLKHFIEWLLPNNNQTSSIVFSAEKNSNNIVYKSSSFNDVIKVLAEMKNLQENWIISSYSFQKVWKVKSLYIVSIKVKTTNLKKLLSKKVTQDFSLFYYNSLLWENFSSLKTTTPQIKKK